MAIIHSLKYTVPFSFVVPLLLLAITHCHLLSLVVTRDHQSLFLCVTFLKAKLLKKGHFSYNTLLSSVVVSLVVSLIITLCHLLYHSLYHSLPLVVSRCHLLSVVATCCTTRCHSLHHLLSLIVPLVVIRCHPLSLDVPLVCRFIND